LIGVIMGFVVALSRGRKAASPQEAGIGTAST
jgi:hypothetical protein